MGKATNSAMRASFLATCLLSVILCGCGSSLINDDALIQQFHHSRGDFERLRHMADEDNLDGRIHADYADPQLSGPRIAEYRRLMRATGVTRLWGHGRSNPLELDVDSNGWLAQGEYKGFSYDPSGPQQSAVSLDSSCFELAEATKADRYCFAVRALGDGWWLLRYEYQ
jgi:hypothetical protein